MYWATGTQIRHLLEQQVRRAGAPSGVFPHVSNLKLSYDSRQPPEHRILGITVVSDGQMLDPARRYRLVTTKYVRTGGDGVTALEGCEEIESEHNGLAVASMVLRNFRQRTNKRIAPSIEGRVRDLAEV